MSLMLALLTSGFVLPSYFWNRPVPPPSSDQADSSNLAGQTKLEQIATSDPPVPTSTSSTPDSAPDQATHRRVSEAYGKLPLQFEANQGQTDSEVKFLSRGSGYSLFLTSTEAVLALSKPAKQKAHKDSLAPNQIEDAASTEPPAVVRMKLSGANPEAQVAGLEELPGKTNYFIGNDPAKWRTDVPSYARVQYREVYPDIDLVYYGNQRQLEYDFVVAPGADPDSIKLSFEGAQDVRIDERGDLVLQTADGEIRQRRPMIYQELEGARQEVIGRYVFRGEHQVGFAVAAYDQSKPLVIDPVLSYSTYLGGSGHDSGASIAVDAAGNAYVTGTTQSTNFPTANPLQPNNNSGSLDDVFVTKLNAAGNTLVYSTYLGGTGFDGGLGITVDASGSAYITGRTQSSVGAGFPTVNPIQATSGGLQDAFVAKLNPTGNALVYSTFLGGGSIDESRSIAVDPAGNAYVTGFTQSTNFPLANAVQPSFGGGRRDTFVAKLNAAGSALVYSTFLGGGAVESSTSFTADDEGNAIAVDSSGNTYVTGTTYCTDFPSANPAQAVFAGTQDVFITKLNSAGSALTYSTFLGGTGGDIGLGVVVDSAGSAYVTGATVSIDFPTARPFQATSAGVGEAFITKLSPAGNALVYSTFLGGNQSDRGKAIAVDALGNAYVTGETNSPNFPANDPLQATIGGGRDAFVTKLSASGATLVYSTFLGGLNTNTGGIFESGNGIAVDATGSAYVTGETDATNFPTANPLRPANDGGRDAFITKISSPPPALSVNTVSPSKGGNTGTVTALISGEGFAPGSTVRLTDAGQLSAVKALGVRSDQLSCQPVREDDIKGIFVRVIDTNTIFVTFNLTGMPLGASDLVVTNPDGRCITLFKGFTIEQGRAPKIYVDVIGRRLIRPGRAQRFTILVGNRGNTDAYGVPLNIASTSPAQITLDRDILIEPPQPNGVPPIDYGAIPPEINTSGGTSVPLLIPFIPAGEGVGIVPITVTVPESTNVGGSVSVVAKPGLPIFTPSPNFGPGNFNLGISSDCAGAIIDGIFEAAGVVFPSSNCIEDAITFLQQYQLQTLVSVMGASGGGERKAIAQEAFSVRQLGAALAVQGVRCAVGSIPVIGNVLSAIDLALAANNILVACFDLGVKGLNIQIVGSFDPNDKTGSNGAGPPRFLSGEEPFLYAIFFENLETATAPAQEVTITDRLDVSKFDLDTFKFGPIAFNTTKVTPSLSVSSEFDRNVDLRPAKNLIVRINAKLDKATGALTWKFTSLDPVTLQPPEDPLAGFLNPNKNPPEGDGNVLFTVMPKQGLATGTEIRNRARIVFDTNAPIDTPEWLNTIDNSKPASQVLPLAARQNSTSFEVKWSGTDTGSGVQNYTIYVSESGGPFTVWLSNTAATSGVFAGQPAKTYAFYSVAQDGTGNQENAKTQAEATTATVPSILQFSAVNYSVAEGAGSIQITVTRVGDISAPAAVDFATGGTAFVRCDAVNGNALDRCDFTTAIDTLRFAAGEGTKSFPIIIIDDAFVEGPETVTLSLSNPSGAAALGDATTATLTIIDNDTAATTNPVDASPFFVRQQYIDFLSREPEQAGFDAWLGVLNRCGGGGPGSDPSCDRIEVSASFFRSREFQAKGFFVYRFYKVSLGTMPRYAEIVPDMVRVTALTDAELPGKLDTFTAEWVTRAEFRSTYDALPNAAYVDKLLQTAGVTLTTRDQLVNDLNSGAKTRAQVLRAIVESQEVFNREYNEAFVAMQYFGYLRRDPETDGLNAWLRVINANPSDYRTMVHGFVTSVEYRLRFGQP